MFAKRNKVGGLGRFSVEGGVLERGVQSVREQRQGRIWPQRVFAWAQAVRVCSGEFYGGVCPSEECDGVRPSGECGGFGRSRPIGCEGRRSVRAAWPAWVQVNEP